MISTSNGKLPHLEPDVVNGINSNVVDDVNWSFTDPPNDDDASEDFLSQIVVYEPTHLNERHYKRLGFFSAIEEITDTQKKFQLLIEEQRQLHEERVAHLKELYFISDLRFQQKIETAVKDLEDSRVKWISHVSESSELAIERAKAKQRLDELEEQLHGVHHAIGEKKERLIEDRILAVRKELEAVIENYQKVYEQRYEINKRTFEDNKDALASKVKRFEALKEQFQERQAHITAKVDKLSLAGINPYVANFLVTAGFAAAIVAGYFFSIFALSKHLNDENVPFFIIQGSHSFITKIFSGNTLGAQFFLLTLLLLGLVISLTVIVWLCHIWINRSEKSSHRNTIRENDSASNRLVVEVGDADSFSYKTYAESGNFFQFWLQLVPILIITGIVFIILFLGTGASEIGSLDTSLTGTLVGSLLTFLMAGLVYLYLIRIVEPRIERHPDKSFLRNNAELVSIIVIFIVSTLAMLFLKQETKEHDSLVIVEFTSVILMAAFLLGYALRFKGLIATANFLERRINALYDAIRDNSRPRPLNLTAAEDKRFKQKYLKLQKQLMELMQQKNDMTSYLLRGDDRGWLRKKLQGSSSGAKSKKWWGFWKSKRTQDENPGDGVVLKLSDLEKQTFPKETMMAKGLMEAIDEVKQQITTLEEAIKARREERTSYCVVLKDEQAKLNNRIDNYRRARERFRKTLFERVDAETIYWEEIMNYLKEGFDLGMWYRVNGLGPSPDYYPLFAKPTKQNGNHE